MFQGYLSVGGIEIVNNARALGYMRTSGCSAQWLAQMDTGGLATFLGDGDYDLKNSSIRDAPWYDPTTPASERFLGVYGLSIDGMDDSTAETDVVEGVGNGGVVGKTRHASKQVRVRAWLTAIGDDALAVGIAWLRASLEPGACGVHSDACGVTDLEVLTAVPPLYGDYNDDLEWTAAVNPLRRFLHGVARTSGPLEVQRAHRGSTYGALIQFTVTSRPFMYGAKRMLDIAPVTPITVQDTPFNLVPYPSADLIDGDIVVSQNISPNPSVEVNATGYSSASAAVSGSAPAAYVTGERTSDIAAEGSWSYRTRLLGNGSTAASGVATITAMHTVSAIPATAGGRMSFSVWAAALIFQSATITGLRVTARFYTSAGVAIGSSDIVIGTAVSSEYGGKAFSTSGVPIPSGAASLRINAVATVSWASSATAASNSDVRVYIDAVAPTIP